MGTNWRHDWGNGRKDWQNEGWSNRQQPPRNDRWKKSWSEEQHEQEWLNAVPRITPAQTVANVALGLAKPKSAPNARPPSMQEGPAPKRRRTENDWQYEGWSDWHQPSWNGQWTEPWPAKQNQEWPHAVPRLQLAQTANAMMGVARSKASHAARPPQMQDGSEPWKWSDPDPQPLKAKVEVEEPFVYGARTLRRALAALGTAESLKDTDSIPTLARAVRDNYIPAMDPFSAFEFFKLVFRRAKTMAHKKAIVYVAHELLHVLARSGELKEKTEQVAEWRKNCIQAFLIPIGNEVKVMTSDQRAVFCKLLKEWGRQRTRSNNAAWSAKLLGELKEAWDVVQ